MDAERRRLDDREDRSVREESEEDPPFGEKRWRNSFVESRLRDDAADAKASGGGEGQSVPECEP